MACRAAMSTLASRLGRGRPPASDRLASVADGVEEEARAALQPGLGPAQLDLHVAVLGEGGGGRAPALRDGERRNSSSARRPTPAGTRP